MSGNTNVLGCTSVKLVYRHPSLYAQVSLVIELNEVNSLKEIFVVVKLSNYSSDFFFFPQVVVSGDKYLYTGSLEDLQCFTCPMKIIITTAVLIKA